MANAGEPDCQPHGGRGHSGFERRARNLGDILAGNSIFLPKHTANVQAPGEAWQSLGLNARSQLIFVKHAVERRDRAAHHVHIHAPTAIAKAASFDEGPAALIEDELCLRRRVQVAPVDLEDDRAALGDSVGERCGARGVGRLLDESLQIFARDEGSC